MLSAKKKERAMHAHRTLYLLGLGFSAEQVIHRYLKNVGKSHQLNICYKSNLTLEL